MTATEVVWTVLGVAVFVGGFALLAMARRLGAAHGNWPVVGRVTRATETTAGVALVFAGYHIVAYGGPVGWVTFRVPVALGWAVFVAAGLAVVLAIATDRVLTEGSTEEDGEG